MKKNLALMTAAAALVAAGPAFAAPALSVTATDNGTALVFTPTTNTPGTLDGFFTDANFSQITVDITGVPAVPSPDLGTVNISVSGATGGGHTLDITATQSGLTQTAGLNGALTQTFNNLIFTGITPGGPVTENFDINGALFNGNTTTFAATPARDQAVQFNDPNLPAITSDAQEFIATFSAADQDLELTQEFSAVAVPEPATLTLLGSALVGLGWFARRRRKSL